jgi:hypothetical protein
MLQCEKSAIESDFEKKSLLVTHRELTKTPLVHPEEDSQGGNAALRISYLLSEGEISGES